MTRFYDAFDSRELSRVRHILNLGGVEYTVLIAAEDSAISEILVAEEDLVYADTLVSSHSGSVH